jgi:hypothetical protein
VILGNIAPDLGELVESRKEHLMSAYNWLGRRAAARSAAAPFALPFPGAGFCGALTVRSAGLIWHPAGGGRRHGEAVPFQTR